MSQTHTHRHRHRHSTHTPPTHTLHTHTPTHTTHTHHEDGFLCQASLCGYLGWSGCKLRAGGKGGETFYGLYEWACVLSTGTTVRIVEFTSEGLGSEVIEVNTCIHEGVGS